jgi:hypothetical protein
MSINNFTDMLRIRAESANLAAGALLLIVEKAPLTSRPLSPTDSRLSSKSRCDLFDPKKPPAQFISPCISAPKKVTRPSDLKNLDKCTVPFTIAPSQRSDVP